MLFNSYEFVLVFLPAVVTGFFFLAHRGLRALALAWLVFASLVFYGWFRPDYIFLIGGSILFNFALGAALGRYPSKWVLGFGVAANVLLLSYYKYSDFLSRRVEDIAGAEYAFEAVALPLAISFFTFQQIAYLVDAHRGLTKEYSFLRYALFVTFFPQLIIGPIVHHSETIPQFKKDSTFRFDAENLAVGT